MQLKKVIVVYKKSSYERYAIEKRDKHFLNLLEENNESIQSFIQSHHQHHQSLETVKAILQKLSLKYKFVYRARKFNEDWGDLVMTVGGDGTFLDAARHVMQKPMLGVNSDLKRSVGMYCGIGVNDLEETLIKMKENRCSSASISRLNVIKNKDVYLPPVLNDILIANANPAAISRFTLNFDDQESFFKSSGVWVSSASGSTGAIRSAGGQCLPIESKEFQFFVREAYLPPEQCVKVSNAVLSQDQSLNIQSLMRKGMFFIDGAHKKYSFKHNDQLEIKILPHPLKVFAYNMNKRSAFEIPIK